MPDMTPTSLVAAVALRIGNSLKTASMFLKVEKMLYKIVYYTLCLGAVNCQKWRWKVRIYVDRRKT